MKRRMLLITGIISAGILAILISCFYKEKDEPSDKNIQVAVSFCDTKNARTTAIWQDVLTNLEQQDFSVEWRDAKADIEKQTADIQELLEYQPEYLVVTPVKTLGLEASLRQASERGTKIILLDRTVDDTEEIPILAEIRADVQWEGEACADLLAEYFDGQEGRILEIRGEKGSSTHKGHSTGFRNQLRNYGNLEIAASTEGNGDRGTARNNVINYLLNSPGEIDAIFADTDEEGIGAVDALEELGLRDEVMVVSVNGIKDVKSAMYSEGYLGCVESTPFMGARLAEIIEKDMLGEAVDYMNLFPGEVYTSRNLDEMQGY